MTRAVIVVEGKSEFIFVQTFIQQLAGTLKYSLTLFTLRDRVIAEGTRGYPEEEASFRIQLINVEGERVRSYIEDNLAALKQKGMVCILGLHDRYTGSKRKAPPNVSANEARDTRLSAQWGLLISVTIACQEVEAWFLGAPSFFLAFHNSLDLDTINDVLGYQLTTCDLETIPHPAAEIDKALRSVGMSYTKKTAEIYRLVTNLDIEELYLTQRTRIPS